MTRARKSWGSARGLAHEVRAVRRRPDAGRVLRTGAAPLSPVVPQLCPAAGARRAVRVWGALMTQRSLDGTVIPDEARAAVRLDVCAPGRHDWKATADGALRGRGGRPAGRGVWTWARRDGTRGRPRPTAPWGAGCVGSSFRAGRTGPPWRGTRTRFGRARRDRKSVV